MHILIAEDDFISRKLLRNILEELGHIVTVTENGKDAYESYLQMPKRLVISDWLMPQMDGIELVRKIRTNDQSDYTYIIMLTANVGQKENYLKAMEAGVDDFLTKPLDRNELEVRLKVAQRILATNSRIQSLESMLTICAYTKQIKFPEEGWQTIETFMKKHLGIALSHGISPDYYKSHIEPELNELKKLKELENS